MPAIPIPVPGGGLPPPQIPESVRQSGTGVVITPSLPSTPLPTTSPSGGYEGAGPAPPSGYSTWFEYYQSPQGQASQQRYISSVERGLEAGKELETAASEAAKEVSLKPPTPSPFGAEIPTSGRVLVPSERFEGSLRQVPYDYAQRKAQEMSAPAPAADTRIYTAQPSYARMTAEATAQSVNIQVFGGRQGVVVTKGEGGTYKVELNPELKMDKATRARFEEVIGKAAAGYEKASKFGVSKQVPGGYEFSQRTPESVIYEGGKYKVQLATGEVVDYENLPADTLKVFGKGLSEAKARVMLDIASQQRGAEVITTQDLMSQPWIPEYVKEDYRDIMNAEAQAPKSGAGYGILYIEAEGGLTRSSYAPFGSDWSLHQRMLTEDVGYLSAPPPNTEAMRAAQVAGNLMAMQGESLTLNVPTGYTEGGLSIPITFTPGKLTEPDNTIMEKHTKDYEIFPQIGENVFRLAAHLPIAYAPGLRPFYEQHVASIGEIGRGFGGYFQEATAGITSGLTIIGQGKGLEGGEQALGGGFRAFIGGGMIGTVAGAGILTVGYEMRHAVLDKYCSTS